MMQYKNKILITGAAGFIGSSLVEHVLKDGQPIKTLKLLIAPWDNLENLPHCVFDVATSDIRDKKSVDKAMKGVDIVYHLAAKTVKRGGTYEYYKDTNVDGTKNLIEAACKHNVKKFIYFSSISVFGLPAWSGDIIDCRETWPKKYSEPYGKTKYESEQLIMMANKKFGLNYIIIRPTTVYGPKDKAGIFQLIKTIHNNHFFFIGTARNKMDYVYVDDVVRAARIAEKSTIHNEDFIIGGGPITQSDLVRWVCKNLNKNVPWLHVPKSLALPLAYIADFLYTAIGVKSILFPERVEVLTSNCYFDMSKAKNVLGYHPTYSFRDGSRITANWLTAHNLI